VARHRLRLTPSADAAVKGLRGRPAADWSRLEPELKAQGCRAAGYRLLGGDSSWSSNIGQGREEKPDCCGETGWPSTGLAREERGKASRGVASPSSIV
jgi:hypothetical protein